MPASPLLHSNQEIRPAGQDAKITTQPLHRGQRFVEGRRTVIVEGRESAEHRRVVAAKHVPGQQEKKRRKTSHRTRYPVVRSQELGNRLISFPRGTIVGPSFIRSLPLAWKPYLDMISQLGKRLGVRLYGRGTRFHKRRHKPWKTPS